jgi:hypothetical protein
LLDAAGENVAHAFGPGQRLFRAPVQLPQQGFLPFGPCLDAGAGRVGERQQHQGVEADLVLHDMGGGVDGGLIVDVPALGEHREFEMVADQKQQLRGLIGVEVQSLGDPARHFQAGFGMMFDIGRLAHVVQQQRQVQHVRVFEVLENLLVAGVGRFGGVDDPVEVLDHLDRVFVRRVAMKEFVLDQAGEPAKLGNVFAEKLDLVHPAQDAGDLSLVLEDGQEHVAGLRRKRNERSTSFRFWRICDRNSGLNLHVALLHVMKHADQAQRVLLENRRGAGGDQPSLQEEAVDLLRFARAPQQGAEPRRFRRLQRHAVGQRVGEQENVARVHVIIAHERLGAPQQVVVAVAEFGGDLRLEPEADDVALRLVM